MIVAVIGGGTSPEHDVSLASAAGTAAAAERAGHDVVRLTIGRDGLWSDGSDPLTLAGAVTALQGCDVAVPMLHGPHGEDGTLAALCDLAGVPYVGSGVGAGATAMDKWTTKLVAEAVGISTARGVLLRAGDDQSWSGPVVVKPVSAGSSHGVTLVRRPEDLGPALETARALDERVLVEELLQGRELDVAVIGRPDGTRQVSPPLEIVVDGVFDHAAKYDGSADFRIPAPLPAAELDQLADLATLMYDALGCRGVARVDFFLTDRGPVLNEVNTAPGFTEHSQVPMMFAAQGLSYPDLVDLLVRDAVEAHVEALPTT